ncbi:MAG TPA: hypothetical protein VHW74_13900 [Mycobacteriales bacterium]|jgi:hypothetical protein|nr:hypothetical protein [Mycobacteriales bacterium]
MRRIACLAGFALGAAVLTAMPVSAAGQPSVGLKVPAHAHAGHPTKVHYSSSGVSGDTLVLQRQVGSAWHTIRTLSASSGTTTVPKLALGIYEIRLAAFTHSGGLVTAKGRVLHVFGTVKFTDLFPQLGHGGHYSTPEKNFKYAFAFYNTAGTYTALTVKDSPCDSVHVEFIPGTDNGTASVPGVSSGTLYLGRHNRSKIHKTVAPQHIGTVHGSVLLNQAWSLLVAQSAGGGQLMTWYVNGSASCDHSPVAHFAASGAN